MGLLRLGYCVYLSVLRGRVDSNMSMRGVLVGPIYLEDSNILYKSLMILFYTLSYCFRVMISFSIFISKIFIVSL
jgi:hypothetical protein